LTAPKKAVLVPEQIEASLQCSQCANVWVRQPVRAHAGLGGRALRAQGRPTELVASHKCDACQTSIVKKGHGKAKQLLMTHVCPH
jgi:hypothetical protein